MHPCFVEGFYKAAYDYGYESKEIEEKAKRRQHDTPVRWLPSIGVGSGLGAGIGALAGRSGARLPSAGIGALVGALGGGLYGLLDRADISGAQKIMKMHPEDRKSYTRAMARQSEIRSRDFRDDLRAQRMIDAIRDRD